MTVFERSMTNRREMNEILRVAKIHSWGFSFYLLTRKRSNVRLQTRIVRIDADGQALTMGDEVSTLATRRGKKIRFTAHSAGITIEFDSSIVPSPPGAIQKRAGECRIHFPDNIQYAQKREAFRVNFSALEEVPMSIFNIMDAPISGSVVDMSATGLRAVFDGNIESVFADPVIIEDCLLRLPNHTIIQCHAEVLHATYNAEEDQTHLRCRFLNFTGELELRISRLINDCQRGLLKRLAGND